MFVPSPRIVLMKFHFQMVPSDFMAADREDAVQSAAQARSLPTWTACSMRGLDGTLLVTRSSRPHVQSVPLDFKPVKLKPPFETFSQLALSPSRTGSEPLCFHGSTRERSQRVPSV